MDGDKLYKDSAKVGSWKNYKLIFAIININFK